jgi:hypothetical protein
MNYLAQKVASSVQMLYILFRKLQHDLEAGEPMTEDEIVVAKFKPMLFQFYFKRSLDSSKLAMLL